MTLADLTCDQREFLALHIHRVVVMWKWVFGGGMLRASADGRSIAICRADLEDLISRGLMISRIGATDVYPTETAKALFA